MSASSNLDSIPALEPPTGVTSNFIDPPTLAPAVYGVAIITIILMTAAVAVRIYVKACLIRQTKIEEYFALFALAGFITWNALFMYMTSTLEVARHQWDVRAGIAETLLYYANIVEIVYIPSMLAAKCAIIFQIKTIFCVGQSREAVWWSLHILLAIAVAYYTASFFALVFQCMPRAAIWNPEVQGTCINVKVLTLSAGIINFVLDGALLVIPMWAIWRLNMSTRSRLGALAVFGVGILTIVIAAIGIAYRVFLVQSDDETWHITELGLWSMPENLGTIIVGCLPSFPRFIKHVTGRDTPASQSGVALAQGKYYTSAGNSFGRPSKTSDISETRNFRNDSLELPGV